MKIPVHMLAFGNGVIREVNVPDHEFVIPAIDVIFMNITRFQHILERVFYWGQNDFQPQQCPSVSIGDVIEYEDTFYLVESMGFKSICRKEFLELKQDIRRSNV